MGNLIRNLIDWSKKAAPDSDVKHWCDGKARYASAQLARDVAARRSQRYGSVTVVAYPCSTCGGYHTGEGPTVRRRGK